MNVFRAMSYLSPLLLGLLLPTILVWAGERKWSVRTTILAGGMTCLGTMLLLLLAWIFSPEPASRILPVAGFSAAASLLSVGLFYFMRGLLFPIRIVQIFCCLVAVGLTTAVFALGPVVRNAQRGGMPGEMLQHRIHWAIAFSPYPVLAKSVFQDEPLHGPVLYKTGAADYYSNLAIPEWTWTAKWYAMSGVVLFLLALILLQGKRKFFPKQGAGG